MTTRPLPKRVIRIRKMRAKGLMWTEIGTLLGISKQAAQQAATKPRAEPNLDSIYPRCECGCYVREYARRIGHKCK